MLLKTASDRVILTAESPEAGQAYEEVPVSMDGSDLTVSATCPQAPASLAPGTACFSFASQSTAQSGYCHFTSTSSKVRANLIVFGTNGGVLTTTPATR